MKETIKGVSISEASEYCLKSELTKFETIYINTCGDARKPGYKRALNGIINALKKEIAKR